MAVHAPITGAPSRAPSNVIPFPDTPVARARRELRYCRDQLMLMKWCGRVKRQRGLSEGDRINLASLFAIRHDEIANAGVR